MSGVWQGFGGAYAGPRNAGRWGPKSEACLSPERASLPRVPLATEHRKEARRAPASKPPGPCRTHGACHANANPSRATPTPTPTPTPGAPTPQLRPRQVVTTSSTADQNMLAGVVPVVFISQILGSSADPTRQSVLRLYVCSHKTGNLVPAGGYLRYRPQHTACGHVWHEGDPHGCCTQFPRPL